MNCEEVRDFALGLPGAVECFPFGPEVFVYKVGGKMFLTLFVGGLAHSVNLKGPPEENLVRRRGWEAVRPGYHMNKRHWNTVELDAGVGVETLRTWIEESWKLVFSSLPKYRQRDILGPPQPA